jgi:hypothetical protein
MFTETERSDTSQRCQKGCYQDWIVDEFKTVDEKIGVIMALQAQKVRKKVCAVFENNSTV